MDNASVCLLPNNCRKFVQLSACIDGSKLAKVKMPESDVEIELLLECDEVCAVLQLLDDSEVVVAFEILAFSSKLSMVITGAADGSIRIISSSLSSRFSHLSSELFPRSLK